MMIPLITTNDYYIFIELLKHKLYSCDDHSLRLVIVKEIKLANMIAALRILKSS